MSKKKTAPTGSGDSSNAKEGVVSFFEELTELTILDEGSAQSFRARAYENALHEIQGLSEDIGAMTKKQLMELPGVGKSTADKIREFLDTGKVEKLEKLRKKYPEEFASLTKIPGLGPKTLVRLRNELGINNIEDLRAAIDQQKLRDLKGLGEKVEENLRKSLARIGKHGKDNRTPRETALPVATALVKALEALPRVKKAMYCGSLRRGRDTVADIDIVLASAKREGISEAFIGLPVVKEVIGSGDTKTSILTKDDLQVDLRIVAPDEFGAAILYFTGSKAHNIKMRQLAIDRGWTLNEYGLTDATSGEVIAQKTEKDIYKALDLTWREPTDREDGNL